MTSSLPTMRPPPLSANEQERRDAERQRRARGRDAGGAALIASPAPGASASAERDRARRRARPTSASRRSARDARRAGAGPRPSLEEAHDRLRQRRRILGRHDQAGLARAHGLGQAADVGGDHRHAQRVGDVGDAALRRRAVRQHHDVGGLEQRLDLLVGEVALEQPHAGLAARRARPARGTAPGPRRTRRPRPASPAAARAPRGQASSSVSSPL